MSFLKFLSNVKVEDVAPAGARTSNAPKQRNPNPTFLGFRIWADGSVYPSQALVDQFNLEYPNATVVTADEKDGSVKTTFVVEGEPGNGMDVIDTRKWGQIKTPQHFIAVAFSPKNSPKIDLFGLTRYTETGAPAASVMTQGASTFGKKSLLPVIEELYGVTPNEEGFIDMAVDTSVKLSSANGLELLPKVIVRGENAGKADYVRRENVDIFAVVPTAIEVAATSQEENMLTLEDSDDTVAEDGAKLFVEEGVATEA